MNSDKGDIKQTLENAAATASRDYAEHQDVTHAQGLSYEVVSGSLPVNSGQYAQTLDCQVSDITVNGTEYAQAVVDYHYPVPVPTLPELLGGQAMGSTEEVWGTAEFPVGA
ncbi:MAG TPA: hypothetical protein VMW83_11660 [Spirochaetia bacterium]|nr:hypothetical protein [Spirochaetia bacterium]